MSARAFALGCLLALSADALAQPAATPPAAPGASETAAAPAAPNADPLDRPAIIAPLAARSLLLDVARAGARLVAVGERGHVLLSDDEGASWRQAKSVPMRTMLTAVSFADERNGWAVGHDELILATRDGGESWVRQHYAPDTQQPLLDVLFADARRGIAIGAYGAYYTTSDSGESWTARKFESQPLVKPPAAASQAGDAGFEDVPPDYHLNRIVAAGPRLYIAAEAGQLYRSDDGGGTWVALPSPYNGSFFGLLPLGGDALLAFGLRGNLFRSNDAGRSWAPIDVGTTAMLTDGTRLPDGRLVIVGLSGTVLVGDPQAASWTLRQQANRKGLAAVLPLADGRIVAVGEDGARVITTAGEAAAAAAAREGSP